MKILCLSLLGITVFLELLVPTHAAKTEFLNINCGASQNETDGEGLSWVSDSPYIDVKSKKSYTLPNSDFYLASRSISYFTDLSQKKYCYLLPVESGTHYLVRARFLYGNFAVKLPLANVFDLLIGGLKWITLDLSTKYSGYTSMHPEIILAAKTDQLSLCLARNSRTRHFVFISTIELRPLDSSLYKTSNADFDKSAFAFVTRYNFGGELNVYRQDMSDQYGRLWYPIQFSGRNIINTSYSLQTKGLPNNVPEKVLQTAVWVNYSGGDINVSNAFTNFFSALSPGSYYFLFYFCNIIRWIPNTFQVLINGERTDWIDFKNYGQCKFIDYNLYLGTADTGIQVVLSGLNFSRPFINAAELYKILGVNNTHHDDAIAIWEIANAISVPDDWSGADPCLPSGYSSTGITCEGNPPRVIIINLTNMSLHGEIPPSISKLTGLTQLLLGNNKLSGCIPEDLSRLKNLTILNLQNNNLTGTVPRGLVKPSLQLRVDPQIKFPTHKRNSWSIPVGCSVLLVLVVIVTAFIWRHRRRSPSHTSYRSFRESQHSSAEDEYLTRVAEYKEEEIRAACTKCISKGSFVSVFDASLRDSRVTVELLSRHYNLGQPEFHKELILLRRMNHVNLVKLVGYCKQPIALVYEYMQCGSLKDNLNDEQRKALGWHRRLDIALQAAEGLLYLHHDCIPTVIHGDIKCSNILLDTKMCAKLAVFGLYKLVESSNRYDKTSPLTEKDDVYSFGVVLVEILSGKPSEDSGRKLRSSDKLEDLIDTSFGDQYNSESAKKVAEIAYKCMEERPEDRPEMVFVVTKLREVTEIAKEDANRRGNISFTPSTEDDMSIELSRAT